MDTDLFCQDIFEPMLVLLKTCEIQDAKYTIAKLQFMLRYKFFAVIHINDHFWRVWIISLQQVSAFENKTFYVCGKVDDDDEVGIVRAK